ncbi:hypothetical protein DRE_07767 [Drechslerella stenobrocha 248]|uniref:Hpc2-related domain-containing protein n=1 Tax=Drechslerella stenobrocha 248 TaxID=1043628 RepID=W7HXR3_9PEZI|nr:hypothetical protein DRE_07767 [Drechslerella stenobrocha 248]
MPRRRANSSVATKGSRNSGRLTVTDLVESDPDAPSKSLKRKASPERSSADFPSAYANEHAPAKQGRASASSSPALLSLLNDPSPPLRPTHASPIANPPPALTPPTSNAPLTNNTNNHSNPPANATISPPQPKAVADIAKASSTYTGKRVASATSAPASPKPVAARAVPTPKGGPTSGGGGGSGGGLLAGTFGDVALGDEDPVPVVPTVVLQISLNGETNKYIDVSKLAEEKYGWAALNPNLARAKLRMGQDASGDEAMMDASESESAMEEKLGGASDPGVSGAGENKPKKRKRRADEYYDANDPFIDDSETSCCLKGRLFRLQRAAGAGRRAATDRED